MKPVIHTSILLSVILILTLSCDKLSVTLEIKPKPPLHRSELKPRTPIKTGTIRAKFGDYYRTFDQHIEKVAPVDSFSNCFFYSRCHNTDYNQINLIRCDSEFVLAIYIIGYSADSLSSAFKVPTGYGRYTEISFYPFNEWNWGDKGFYSMWGFYGNCLTVLDNTNDILTGTFSGKMGNSLGLELPVTDGEFKIPIFRKYMPCYEPDSTR